jgi:hypothetical protein
MGLSGSLREFALSEILQLLSSQRKTGSLRMTRGSDTRVLYLLEGRIAAVRDKGFGDEDPLASFLRRVHRLSNEQVRGISSIHAESGRDLVDLLLNGRYIEREELAVLYERLVLDVLHEMLGWEDGQYSFSNVSPPETVLPLSLSTESMLMEAVRRTDEMRRYKAQLTDPSLVLGLKELPDPDAALSEEEKELFGLVDGRRTLGELVQEAPLTDFEAYEALFRLVEAGWIEIQGRRAVEVVEPEAESVTAARGAALRREGTLAVAALVVVALFQVLAWRTTLPAAKPTRLSEDAFATLGVRDVRFAIETYRASQGRYPETLRQLVESGWLTDRQLEPEGWKLLYSASSDSSYQLAVAARPE